MAVVEKKPEVTTASPFDRLALASLAGVVYVLGSLAVAFKAVPAVCQLAGLTAETGFGPVLSGVLSLAVLVVLTAVGFRLLGGAHSRPGLRGGIFLGFVFLALWALFSRWVGGILEGSTHDGWLSGMDVGVGTGIALALSVLFGFWLLRIFLRPSFERRMIALEEGGWFRSRAYKPGQGVRVRRGTILGILLMTGAGIWVMMNHRVLERGSANWELNVPFTGNVAIDDVGDALRGVQSDGSRVLDEGTASTLRIINAGSASDSLTNQAAVSRDSITQIISPLARDKLEKLDALLQKLHERETQLGQDISKQTDPKRKELLDTERVKLSGWIATLKEFRTALRADDEGKLPDRVFLIQKELDRFVTIEQERERDRRSADQAAGTRNSLKEEMQWIVDWVRKEPLPVAAYQFSRYEVRDYNEKLDPLRYRVIRSEERADDGKHVNVFADLAPEYRFLRNQIVPKTTFNAAVVALQKDPDGVDKAPDVARDLKRQAEDAAPEARNMKGNTSYASILLMPSVRYTVPLLMLALAIWIAWRIVNQPTFADFLIATEAEMNKVSWTTRQRLFQDTLVVLVTMVLMAVFLFLVDIGWARLLSSKPIGVLKVQEQKQQPKQESDLKW